MNLEEIYGKFTDFEYRTRIPTNNKVELFGINDAPFVVKPSILGKQIKHPAYQVWQHMLERCYNNKLKDKYPTYLNITCCEEWLHFTNFAKWLKDHYKENYQLDKDLLVKDNKVYSPETCIFVPREINMFLTPSNGSRGIYPIGVTSVSNSNKFMAQIHSGGLCKYLGIFNTPEEAHRAWQKAKLEQAIAFNFPPLQRVIDQLKFEIENNLETLLL